MPRLNLLPASFPARAAAIAFTALAALSACSQKGASPASPGDHAGGAEAPATLGQTPSGAPPASAYPSPAAESEAAGYSDDAVAGADPAIAPERRSKGLGTAYGETRESQVRSVPFIRQSDRPDAVLALRYNDPQGIRDLAQWRGQAGGPAANASYGALQFSLLDERRAPLPGVDVAGQRYAVGAIGSRYMIGIRNDTASRYEVVASVDGLDVIDGREANLNKRGYVVDPYTSFVIEGWRTSSNTVAAFRFSALEESYAAQTGRPRDIGVVGVAFFGERAVDYQELHRRDTADPFPGRYAPPPPGRR